MHGMPKKELNELLASNAIHFFILTSLSCMCNCGILQMVVKLQLNKMSKLEEAIVLAHCT